MADVMKSLLIDRLYEIGAIKFGEFQLKAGGTSPIYIDLREIISHPRLLKQLAEIMAMMSKDLQFDNICGVPYGALAIASVISVLADRPMIMTRKEAKEHGTKKRVEGQYSNGQTSLIIEDVVTTGSSVAETARVLRADGLVVKDAIVILDREAGAEERLAEVGIRFTSIFKLSDLTSHLPNSLDEAMRQKVALYLAGSKTPGNPIPILGQPQAWSLERRRAAMSHPTSQRLIDIMLKKKSNLCLAADITTASGILQLAQEIGSHICALKLHVDIIEDFTLEFAGALQKLASELDFLILEDRKFADTGNVVALQTGGVHQLKSWVDAFTVHGVSGPGVLEGLKSVCKERPIGCFLVAQMSSENNLLDENYQKAAIRMASSFPDMVAGFICQKRVTENPSLLYLSPGVHLEKTTDNLGQQWRSPQDAICRDKVDIVIVGRGVISVPDRKAAVEQYREASWRSLIERK